MPPVRGGPASPEPSLHTSETDTSSLSRTQKKKRRLKLARAQAALLLEAGIMPEDAPAGKRQRSAIGEQAVLASSELSTQASLTMTPGGTTDHTSPRTDAAALTGSRATPLPARPARAPQPFLPRALAAQRPLRADLSSQAAVTHAALAHRPLAEGMGEAASPRRADGAQGPGQAGVALPGPPRSRLAPHGNYHRYYGYRLGQAFDRDPRLAVMERSWFARRRCMDVGCNEGLVTLALAGSMACQSMVGVDIDPHLIKRACTTLRALRTSATQRAAVARAGGTDAGERRAARDALQGLSQTWFVHADFLESVVEPASLDTITCLSVTKWVHLNRGDEGLQALFIKFHTVLAPGGLLIVEPQPWSSYQAAISKLKKQRAKCSEEERASLAQFHPLDELQLRPDDFPAFLCDTLGFRLVRRLQPGEAASGFHRSLLVLRKA
ncbi:hypothetical protein ACKKBG_A09600 [Auxenochlorella protothecoides x Auxenochlorella symbiontica]